MNIWWVEYKILHDYNFEIGNKYILRKKLPFQMLTQAFGTISYNYLE